MTNSNVSVFKAKLFTGLPSINSLKVPCSLLHYLPDTNDDSVIKEENKY